NTLDAHRLIHLAGTHSQATQLRMVARLFRAFFEEGLDIGNPKILIDLAVEVGISHAHAEELLESAIYREEVLREIEAAKRMGVTGVPCFLFESRYVLSGAQPAELIAQTILEVKAAKV